MSTWAHRLEKIGRSGGRSSKFAEGQPKPPQERGAHLRSHATNAAPTESMRSNTSCLTNVCGEPVSRSATQPQGARVLAPLCTATFVVKEASSRVMIPPKRQGPCSGSAREGSTPGVTAKTSGLLSAGASEKQVENSVGGPGQARARPLGLSLIHI